MPEQPDYDPERDYALMALFLFLDEAHDHISKARNHIAEYKAKEPALEDFEKQVQKLAIETDNLVGEVGAALQTYVVATSPDDTEWVF